MINFIVIFILSALYIAGIYATNLVLFNKNKSFIEILYSIFWIITIPVFGLTICLLRILKKSLENQQND